MDSFGGNAGVFGRLTSSVQTNQTKLLRCLPLAHIQDSALCFCQELEIFSHPSVGSVAVVLILVPANEEMIGFAGVFDESFARNTSNPDGGKAG